MELHLSLIITSYYITYFSNPTFKLVSLTTVAPSRSDPSSPDNEESKNQSQNQYAVITGLTN